MYQFSFHNAGKDVLFFPYAFRDLPEALQEWQLQWDGLECSGISGWKPCLSFLIWGAILETLWRLTQTKRQMMKYVREDSWSPTWNEISEKTGLFHFKQWMVKNQDFLKKLKTYVLHHMKNVIPHYKTSKHTLYIMWKMQFITTKHQNMCSASCEKWKTYMFWWQIP